MERWDTHLSYGKMTQAYSLLIVSLGLLWGGTGFDPGMLFLWACAPPISTSLQKQKK